MLQTSIASTLGLGFSFRLALNQLKSQIWDFHPLSKQAPKNPNPAQWLGQVGRICNELNPFGNSMSNTAPGSLLKNTDGWYFTKFSK